MRRHKKLIVTVALICILGLVVGGSLSALLLSGGENGVDLTYSTNPQDVVIQVESGGGPPPLWEDYMPGYRLFGDGTVIMQDPNTNKGLMVQGKLSAEDMHKLLQQIKDTGFFDLDADYGDETVYDGSYTIITVKVASGTQQVLVYMTEVPAFSAARNVILNYPVGTVTDYVPAQGYLVSMTYRGGSIATLGPENPAYAALPDPAALASAADDYGAAVPVEGKKFAILKRLESGQQYLGFLVHTDAGDLVVYPVYLPRSVYQGTQPSGSSGGAGAN